MNRAALTAKRRDLARSRYARLKSYVQRRWLMGGDLHWMLRIWLKRRRLGLATLEDAIRDRRWGGPAGGVVVSPDEEAVGDFRSTHYWELRRIFADVPIRSDDVLVDFGCGRGRLLYFWLSLGLQNRMVGLEINPDLAADAARNVARYPNVTVVAGNGIDHLPADGTLYWLFRPFKSNIEGRQMMDELSRRLENHDVRVVVYRPQHLEAFRTSRWSIEQSNHGTLYDTAVISRR